MTSILFEKEELMKQILITRPVTCMHVAVVGGILGAPRFFLAVATCRIGAKHLYLLYIHIIFIC